MDRRRVGRAGETIAAAYLSERGVKILARNLTVESGELDIVGTVGGRRVAFEVRTVTGDRDPLDAFDQCKYDRVWRLARHARCSRVDLVAVGIGPLVAEVRWVPSVHRG